MSKFKIEHLYEFSAGEHLYEFSAGKYITLKNHAA